MMFEIWILNLICKIKFPVTQMESKMIKNTKEMKKDVRENMRGGNGAVTITNLFTKDLL